MVYWYTDKLKDDALLPGSIAMPRDPELMRKLQEIGGRRPEDVTLQNLVEMCVLLERHEDQQHREYAEIARREGYPEIAEVFEDLAEGEKFYHSKIVEMAETEVKG